MGYICLAKFRYIIIYIIEISTSSALFTKHDLTHYITFWVNPAQQVSSQSNYKWSSETGNGRSRISQRGAPTKRGGANLLAVLGSLRFGHFLVFLFNFLYLKKWSTWLAHFVSIRKKIVTLSTWMY